MGYTDRILDKLQWDVILDARRTMLGLPEGSNSSLALLGGIANEGEHVGFNAGYERLKQIRRY